MNQYLQKIVLSYLQDIVSSRDHIFKILISLRDYVNQINYNSEYRIFLLKEEKLQHIDFVFVQNNTN